MDAIIYSIFSIYRIYGIFSIYSIYGIYSIYSIFSTCSIHNIHRGKLEEGEEPVNKPILPDLACWVCAEWDGRTCLARPKSQEARTGKGKPPPQHFPCSVDHEQDWQPYTVNVHSATVCDDHTNNHTYFTRATSVGLSSSVP